MIKASEEYRQEMELPFRNQWLMEMSVGLIKEKFQAGAYIDSSSPLYYLSKYAEKNLFSNVELDGSVATFEKNMFRADGDSIFMDKETADNPSLHFGVISQDVSDYNGNINFEITFKSTSPIKGLAGLTLNFYEVYPTNLNIKSYAGNSLIINRDYTCNGMMFDTQDDFGKNADTLKVTITRLNKPYARFRLSRVMFGIGVTFTNQDFLLSGGSFMENFNPCSLQLPTKDFNITLNNPDGKYDVEDKDSLINLATTGQDITLVIKYKFPDGHVESIRTERFELSTFDVTKTQIRVNGVDFLRNENSEVNIESPDLFKEDTTLYDIAEYVLKSIQNITFRVKLDPALRDIPMRYNKIKTSCKDAIMMIAGAARCNLSLTPEGATIRRLLHEQDERFEVTSPNAEPYCNLKRCLSPALSVRVASFEVDRTRADGDMVFPSETVEPTVKVGYISKPISDQYGNFAEKPVLELNSKDVFSVDFINVLFGEVSVKSMRIETYYNDSPLQRFDLNDLNTSDFTLTEKTDSFNKLRITINSIHEPYRRVRIQGLSFENKVYDLTSVNCIDKPECSAGERVRNIIVNYSYQNKKEDGTYETINDSVTVPCSREGTDFEYTNPFVTTKEVAEDVGTWLSNYYKSSIKYNVNLVGDPIIETNDFVKIYNDYNNMLLGSIDHNEILFQNGGIRGKIEVRREE